MPAINVLKYPAKLLPMKTDASRNETLPPPALPRTAEKSGLAKKLIAVLASFTILATGTTVLLITFDAPAAARLTDNYLRPLLGPDLVVSLEKIYYNSADKLHQITYRPGSNQGPAFLEPPETASAASQLDLTPIPTNNGLRPLRGEGVWVNRPLSTFPGEEIMAYTFVRPDITRPYANVTLVQMDMKVLHLSAVAGTAQPGGPVGRPGPGLIPPATVRSGRLIAAFDGGFQYRDGQYGMIVGHTTYLPLRQDIGTLIGYKNGALKIVNYTGQDLGTGIEFVRQNCPILIDHGELSVVNPKNKALWGRTFSSDMYTWRSGLGLTAGGDLIFAVGNSLSPVSLAYALKMAGAESAIQLDINPYWVRFNIFDSLGNGQYQTSTLIKGIQDGSKEYLHGYIKDFFYIYQNA